MSARVLPMSAKEAGSSTLPVLSPETKGEVKTEGGVGMQNVGAAEALPGNGGGGEVAKDAGRSRVKQGETRVQKANRHLNLRNSLLTD